MKVLLICALICLAKANKQIELAPHHADLQLFDNKQNTFPGSGVIVSLKHIVTAAINIKQFSKWEVTHGNSEFGQDTFTSTVAFVHPNYDAATLRNNLGMIVLPYPIKISPAALPVGLPNFNSMVPLMGEYGLVASYNTLLSRDGERKLRYGPHKVVNNQECAKIFPNIQSMSDYFCATQKLFTACGGSEGTGFVVEVDKKRVLAGIMSYGKIWEDCSKSEEVTYIRISPYVNWIRQKIK